AGDPPPPGSVREPADRQAHALGVGEARPRHRGHRRGRAVALSVAGAFLSRGALPAAPTAPHTSRTARGPRRPAGWTTSTEGPQGPVCGRGPAARSAG